MLDIQFIRDNPEKVKEAAKNKNIAVDVDKLLTLDQKRRELLQDVEKLRHERNETSAQMKNGQPSPELIAEGRRIKEVLSELEAALAPVEEQFLELLKAVPNIPLDSVPVGSTEEENVIVRQVGEKPNFNFDIKNHAEIAQAKDWIDKERAVKIAGTRFVYTKGDLVLLEFALWQYGFSVVTNESILQKIIDEAELKVSAKPYVPVIPPAVAKKEVFEATGRLNKEEQTYKIEDEDLWLNASAEHTISPMYMNEIIPEDQLPIRYVGYTTAFRREAGTYGKDTEGLFRLHQFNKLEMESFTDAGSSLDEHLLQVAIQEYLMQQLELPYQVLEKCTADIGRPNAKGVDIEAWLPSQETYRETHTADYITDYQARAMKTRVRKADGSIELVHTNDATAFSQRPLIAIIENFQQEDGSVKVPKVLQPFMGGKEVI
jgi:seryl-tRNA synthetase